MTTNVGAIKYTVEAETGDLLTAEKVVDKTTGSMAKDFAKVDTAVKKTTNKVKKSAKAVDMALQSEAKASERAARTAERAAERKVKAAEKAADRAASESRKASSAEKAAAERSERATTAAAKKAANEKIAAANRSARATSAANKRAAAVEQKRIAGFGRSTGQAGIQIQQFVGQIQGGQNAMLALSAQSADLGFVLGAPLIGAVVGISASIAGFLLPSLFKGTEGLLKTKEAADTLKASLDKLNEQQKASATLVFQQQLEKDKKALAGLRTELGLAQNAALAVEQVGETFISKLFGVGTKEAKENISALSGSIVALELDIKETEKNLSDLGAKGTSETSKFKKAVEDFSTSLEQQTIALRDGEEAAFKFATAQQLGLKIGEELPANIDAQIEALFRLKKAKEDTAKQDSDTDRLTSQVQGLGVSPEDQIRMRLDKELELLRLAQEQKIEIEGTYQERRIELQAQADEKIAGLNKKTAEESILNYEALENQIVGTFASIATGAQDGKEAIRGLAQAVLTQMIGSLVKLGIQAMIGQTATTAATSASMGVIATAAAPAAALVSLATSGANSPLAIAGMASAGTAASGIALAGGRQFGGGVSGGNAYRMGEDGPEILKQGNKNIVIPGENGQVISNKDLGGGGGTTININNMASGVEVQATPSNDGRTIDIAVRRAVAEITNQVATGNGKFMNALKSNTNMTSKATR